MDLSRRLQLHELLLTFNTHVYFQPPPNLTMEFPAIVYKRDGLLNQHADNGPYLGKTRYSVTVIDEDPDSEIVGQIARLPLCTHSRFYTSENLNHDAFTLYF